MRKVAIVVIIMSFIHVNYSLASIGPNTNNSLEEKRREQQLVDEKNRQRDATLQVAHYHTIPLNDNWRIPNKHKLSGRFTLWELRRKDIKNADLDSDVILIITDGDTGADMFYSRFISIVHVIHKNNGTNEKDLKFCVYDKSYTTLNDIMGAKWKIIQLNNTPKCLRQLKRFIDTIINMPPPHSTDDNVKLE